jgi:hypothetical protein
MKGKKLTMGAVVEDVRNMLEMMSLSCNDIAESLRIRLDISISFK